MTASRTALLAAIAAAAGLLACAPAAADIVLSELIVDLQPGKQVRDDIEIWNNSPDRSFIAVEPREIVNASLPTQSVRRDPDPEKLGLLVSPARMILEPGQRKLIRVGGFVVRRRSRACLPSDRQAGRRQGRGERFRG